VSSLGILDALGIGTAHVVGHDWGAAVAWLTAMFVPDRLNELLAGWLTADPA
jgi:pimeloyl-ACP methyl ester carboxylesterase